MRDGGMKILGAIRPRMAYTGVEQSQSKTCEDASCRESTREGKDYCARHIDQQPYVLDLLGRMEQKKTEDLLVRKQGARAVNLKGITAQEIILHLRQGGTRTEERLTREVRLDKSLIHQYVLALKLAGMVTLAVTPRHNFAITLTDFDPKGLIQDEPNS